MNPIQQELRKLHVEQLNSHDATKVREFLKIKEKVDNLRVKDNLAKQSLKECIDPDLLQLWQLRHADKVKDEAGLLEFVCSLANYQSVHDVVKEYKSNVMNDNIKCVTDRLAMYMLEFIKIQTRAKESGFVFDESSVLQYFLEGIRPTKARKRLLPITKLEGMTLNKLMDETESLFKLLNDFDELESEIPVPNQGGHHASKEYHGPSSRHNFAKAASTAQTPNSFKTEANTQSSHATGDITKKWTRGDSLRKAKTPNICGYCHEVEWSPEHEEKCPAFRDKKSKEASSSKQPPKPVNVAIVNNDENHGFITLSANIRSCNAARGNATAVPIEMIVDSAAKRSGMTVKMRNKLENMITLTVSSPTSDTNIVTASGGEPMPSKLITVGLELPGQSPLGSDLYMDWSFVELPDSQREYVLIGLDFLEEMGAIDKDGVHLDRLGHSNIEDDSGDDLEDVSSIEGDALHPTPVYHIATGNQPEGETFEQSVDRLLNDPKTALSPAGRSKLKAILMEQAEIFGPLHPEGSKLKEFKVELLEDKVYHQRARPMYPELRAEAKLQCEQLLKSGIARQATGRYAHPLVMVKKTKNGVQKRRMCVDYSVGINKFTKRHTYGAPNSKIVLQEAAGKKLYGKFDLRSGYHQVRVEPDSIKYTGFITPDYHLEFNRMPFGVMNGVDHFQECMEEAYESLLCKSVMIFVDDLLHYASSEEEYIATVEKILLIAKEYRLRFSLEKTVFAQEEIEIIGYILNSNGHQMCPSKVTAIQRMTEPASTHDLRVFLGACNGFRDFIPHYEALVRPFQNLLKKDSIFTWTDLHRRAYQGLVKHLSSDTMLASGTEPGELIVRTDASDLAIGGAIVLQDQAKKEHTVCYFSKTLNPTQQRWTTFEKELYAILYVITAPSYQQLLKMRTFTVETDHKNLIWLDNKSYVNNKLANWKSILMGYSFNIRHIPGHSNCMADYLSRHTMSVIDDGQSAKVLWVSTQPLQETEWLGRLRAEQVKEAEQHPGFGLAEGSAVYSNTNKLYITKSGMIIIPITMRKDVMTAAHSTFDAGHKQGQAMLRDIRAAGYAWKGMSQEIKEYVKSCPICQKYRQGVAQEPIVAMGTTMCLEPWHSVHMDTLGPFAPDKQGRTMLKVMTDPMTKATFLYPTVSNSGTDGAEAVFVRVVCGPGVPEKIITDGGTEYTNSLLAALTEKFKVSHHQVTPYTPTANSPVERENEEIMKLLRCLTADFKFDHQWTDLVMIVEYIINHTYHSAIDTSPYVMWHGSDPSLSKNSLNALVHNSPQELQALTKPEYKDYLTQLQQRMLKIHQAARQTLQSVGQARLLKHNIEQPTKYQLGDYVLLHPTSKRDKLAPLLDGPYKVTQVLDELTYVLQMITDPSKTVQATTKRIVPFKFSEDYSEEELKSLQAGDIKELLVEKIIDHEPKDQPSRDNLQFLVKWKNFDESENSYVAFCDIDGCSLLEDYILSVPLLKKILRREKKKKTKRGAM